MWNDQNFRQRQNEYWQEFKGNNFSIGRSLFDREITVMSNSVAYWDVSTGRFYSAVIMTFEDVLAEVFTKELKEVLLDRLGVDDKDGFETCKRYLEDNPETRAERAKLEERQRI